MSSISASSPSSVDILKIIEKVKGGSLSHFQQLLPRIAQDYGERGIAILDAILSHFKLPSSQDIDFRDDQAKATQWKVAAIACIAPLTEVSRWLQAQSTRTAVTISTSLRLFSSAPDYIACLLELLTTAKPDPSMPLLYHAVALLCDSLLQSCPRLLSVFANSSDMLDLAIVLWTTSYRGDPLLYPSGLSAVVPFINETGDPALRLFHALALENPRGMLHAILERRICELDVFAKRSIERIGVLHDIQRLPHLSHLQVPTVEIGNARYIVQSLNALVQLDLSLRSLLLSSTRNTGTFTQTLAVMSQRLYERDPSVDQQMGERVRHLLEFLDLIACVVEWVATTSTNIIRNMRRIIDSGAFHIIGHCIPFIAHQRYTKVETIFETVVPYSMYVTTWRSSS